MSADFLLRDWGTAEPFVGVGAEAGFEQEIDLLCVCGVAVEVEYVGMTYE